MASALFTIVFLLPATLLGLAAGWWLCSGGVRRPSEPRVDTEPRPRPDWIMAESVMARLEQLAEDVAADVGRHSNRVHEIDSELRCGDGNVNVIAAVEKLLAANETMQAQLNAAEHRLQAQAIEISNHSQEARTDALTKLANRRAFDEEMQKCVDDLRSRSMPSCVAMIDIDHFKIVNDQCGHPAGDEVLRGIARVLRRILPESVVVCRYGGEEFAVVFPGAGIDDAKAAVERVRCAIKEEVFQSGGQGVRVTVTAGTAQIGFQESAGDAIQRADDALYAGKQNGRDCGYWHDGNTAWAVTRLRARPEQTRPDRIPAAVDSSPASRQEVVPDCPIESLRQLLDRESFLSDVKRLASGWMAGGAPPSVVLVEVDRYAQMREETGQEAADAALRVAADAVRRSVKSLGSLARVDDGVFAVLLPGSGSEQAWAVADNIQRSVRHFRPRVHGEGLRFTVSVGVADIAKGCVREDLMERAFKSLATNRLAKGDSCASLAHGPSSVSR